MANLHISLPESLKTYIEERVAQSGYASVDDYFLELIQQDQQHHAQEKLNTLLLEGIESLEQGNAIEATEEWWEQERSQLINQFRQKRS